MTELITLFRRLCEQLLGPERSDTVAVPPGARRLTDDELSGRTVVGSDDEVLELATNIASRGFEWRDQELRHITDRAATILSAASVVIGIGAGLLASDPSNLPVRALLIAALVVFACLAFFTVLALRQRPLPRQTGYAVQYAWSDRASLHREHHRALLERARELDAVTTFKARIVVAAAILLAAEVLLLTLAMLIRVYHAT